MDTRVASLAWGIVALESQFSGEGLVQQRLLQRLQRGVLPLVELARLEEEAFAEFEQEVLNVIKDGGFEIVLAETRLRFRAQELKHERLLEHIPDGLHDFAFLHELADARLVAAEGEALVEAAVELAFQLLEGPILTGGFDLVEATLIGILHAEQEDVVGPTEGEGARIRFPRRWLGNWGVLQFCRRRLQNLRLANHRLASCS